MKPYYEGDGVTLYHGDCRDVLPTITSGTIGAVVTSPPYNLGGTSGGFANLSGGYASYTDQLPHTEYVEWQRWVLSECWRTLSEDGAMFYNHKPRILDGMLWTPLELNPGLPLRQIIIWARPGGFNWSETHLVPRHEWIMLFAKTRFRISKATSSAGDVWRINPVQGKDRHGHPAPFPLALAAQAIRIASESSTGAILDPFAGTGTTLRAAMTEGRKAIGIELDERYCEIAARRLDQGVLDFASAT